MWRDTSERRGLVAEVWHLASAPPLTSHRWHGSQRTSHASPWCSWARMYGVGTCTGDVCPVCQMAGRNLREGKDVVCLVFHCILDVRLFMTRLELAGAPDLQWRSMRSSAGGRKERTHVQVGSLSWFDFKPHCRSWDNYRFRITVLQTALHLEGKLTEASVPLCSAFAFVQFQSLLRFCIFYIFISEWWMFFFICRKSLTSICMRVYSGI